MTQARILVVDSKPSTRAKVQSALAGVPVQVLSAVRLSEVEAHLLDGPISVFFCAATLPDESGYTLAKQIRGLCPDASIFLMAGGFEVYDAARATEAGVTARLPLPLSDAGVLACLEAALGPLSAVASGAASVAPPSPLGGEERWAQFVPGDIDVSSSETQDLSELRPALEALVVELLPEVVEGVVRHTLDRSSTLRDLVAAVVEEAVREQLPTIATRIALETKKKGSNGAPPA